MVVAFILIALKANIKLPDQDRTLRQKLARIDWFGSVTLVATVGSLLLAISLKTTEELPWSHPLVWVLFIASAVSGGLFVLVEKYWAPEPIVPLRLLTQRTPLAVAMSNFLVSIVGFSMLYNIPLYFSAVRLQNASQAGLHLLPNSVCTLASLVHATLDLLL